MMLETHNKPMAIKGLKSYRYRGRYGYIMIGATDTQDALREASRSTDSKITIDNLEAWDYSKYLYIQAIQGNGKQMNTKLLKHTRELFKSYDVPEHVRRSYQLKWVRSIRNLGDKWLFAKPITRKEPTQ